MSSLSLAIKPPVARKEDVCPLQDYFNSALGRPEHSEEGHVLLYAARVKRLPREVPVADTAPWQDY